MANLPNRFRLGPGVVFPLVVSLVVSCQPSRPPTVDSGPPPPESAPLDSLPAEPTPPPPPEGAFLGQISPTQASQLNSLGIEVVVPGVIPPGFKVAELRITQAEGPLGYMIVYQHPGTKGQGQCFAVEFSRESMGDPPATAEKRSIKPPLFKGQTYGLHHGQFTEPALQRQFPGGALYSDWLQGSSGAYRLIGAVLIGQLFPALQGCQDVTPEQAVELVENFTLLAVDPMDPGF